MHQLTLLLNNAPAALERVLQVTRYRGFVLESCDVRTEQNNLTVKMQVSGSRPVSLLTSQLNKLHDLEELCLTSLCSSVGDSDEQPVVRLAAGC
ncbi:acetolactate synthase 2 small subunit [Neptunicella marina]|uniref:Acetolactate synthase 2 small subunit n=1 Tax=Neptunicella marina TaxID=2125989 RepID=A0A8J6IV59_9ALTE|nr:acetolactate synthase 2 small subunit [Neptunicella marina]MBC3766362.1 acetolactate synthase 2 small subunit [Neptunicella marina]